MIFQKTWYKLRFGPPIILVSGLPRSGTSMLMQMLDAGGIPSVTDHLRKADEDNPKGYYELEQVKTLDKASDKSWLRDHRGKSIKVISFLLKELPLNLNYKVVFIRRDLDEVLASQNKMLVTRGEASGDTSDSKMKANYQNHLLRVKYFLKHTPNFDTLYVNHREIVKSPSVGARNICDFLGNSLDEAAMVKSVDSKLYRNRS